MSDERLYAVRGATCCENTIESIQNFVPALYAALLQNNDIKEESIVSVQFSMTSDLNVLNPATALRKAAYADQVPLFVSAEPYIVGGLPFVIRVLICFYGSKKPTPLYLNGAEVLRPDLSNF